MYLKTLVCKWSLLIPQPELRGLNYLQLPISSYPASLIGALRQCLQNTIAGARTYSTTRLSHTGVHYRHGASTLQPKLLASVAGVVVHAAPLTNDHSFSSPVSSDDSDSLE